MDKVGEGTWPPRASDIELLEAKTYAEEVYVRLRRDIVSGRLKPGDRLRFDTLRERYGVSISPLREALSRLASDRLVIALGQKGFRVAPVSLAELVDIGRVRILLETTALRDAIEHGTLNWEAEIVAALHRLTSLRLPQAPEEAEEEWEIRHRAFHAALISACRSPWLLNLCEAMRLQFERYRRRAITGMTLSAPLYEQITNEHVELSRVVLSRDPDQAAAKLAGHFQHVVTIVQASYGGAAATTSIETAPPAAPRALEINQSWRTV